MCSLWSSCQRNWKGRSWGSSKVNRRNDKESFKQMALQHIGPVGKPTRGRGSGLSYKHSPAAWGRPLDFHTTHAVAGVRFHPHLSSDSSGLLLPELVCSTPLLYTSSIWTKAKAVVGTKAPHLSNYFRDENSFLIQYLAVLMICNVYPKRS